MKNIKTLLLFVLLSAPVLARAQVGVGTDLFQRGQTRASISGAYGSAFNQDYFVMGLGLGYYLARGLEVGVDGEAWWGENPNIYKLSPQIRYVFLQSPNVKPYIGAFYRRTYFEGEADLDSTGGRAGIYTRLSPRTFAGVGIVYEKYTDCDDRIYSSCSSTYPEFSISVGF